MILRLVTHQKQISMLRERGLIILNKSIEFFGLNPDLALLCWTSSAFVVFVQSQDKTNEHAITESLLQAFEKHHNTEHEVSTHTDDYKDMFQSYLFCKILRNYFYAVSSSWQMFMSTWQLWTFSSGGQRPRRPGWTGPWPSCCTDQRSGNICFYRTQPWCFFLSVSGCSLFLPPRCRPECMRSCAQC